MSFPIAPILNIHLPRTSGGSIQIVVRCPFCNKNHKHGGGSTLTQISSYFGERLAHCDGEKTYVIAEAEKPPPKSYSAEYHRDYHRKYYHEKVKAK